MAWADVWGDSPGQNAREVAAAFYEGRTLKRSGCRTDGEKYWLNDHVLARRIKPEHLHIAVAATLKGHGWGSRRLEFKIVYSNKQNARHLAALGLNAVFRGGVGEGGTLVDGRLLQSSRWYTKEEIAATPVFVPAAKPTRTPRFVNLTMELFPT